MNGNRNKWPKWTSGPSIIVVIFGLLITVSGAKAQTANPDGSIGRPIFELAGDYVSATGRENFYVKDIQNLHGQFSLPLTLKVTGSLFADWRRQDSVRYSFGIRTRLYLFGRSVPRLSNPDGPLGEPVFDLKFGLRTSSDPNQAPKTIGTLEVLLPSSEKVTFQAGYHYYQSIQVQDVRSFALGLTYFAGPTVLDSFLVNPDGPVGYPNITLTGGGSKYGGFGQIESGCPLSRQLSVTIVARAELLKSPYRHALTAGLGLTWFAP